MVVSPKSKRTKPVRKPKRSGSEPKFIADIEFRGITLGRPVEGEFF
jgi:bifunctional non-homologous end joining protein LigD